jgi:hypothetical protein
MGTTSLVILRKFALEDVSYLDIGKSRSVDTIRSYCKLLSANFADHDSPTKVIGSANFTLSKLYGNRAKRSNFVTASCVAHEIPLRIA